MLPVLILTVPPIVLGGGYSCWSQGQQLVMSILSRTSTNSNDDKKHHIPSASVLSASNAVPDQTFATYAAGVITLLGTYNVSYAGMSMVFLPHQGMKAKSVDIGSGSRGGNGNGNGNRGGMANNLNHQDRSKIWNTKNKHQPKYIPPQSFKELYQRVGRPGLVRVGAAGFAFFCSGAAQTYFAFKLS